MPYNYPDRVAVATSSVPTPVGFVAANVPYPDVSAFSNPFLISANTPVYSDSGLIAAETGLYSSGLGFSAEVDQPRTMTLVGLQTDSNVTNNYASGLTPAANFLSENIRQFGYFNEAYHYPFFDSPQDYITIQFANCYYRPWPTGSFEEPGSLEEPMPARVAEGFSVLGSIADTPYSYQFKSIVRGGGDGYTSIVPFRRIGFEGGDSDGTAYWIIGCRGQALVGDTPTAEFVSLFDFGNNEPDVECVISACHASELSSQMAALGTLTYTVLGEPVTEQFLSIFTPGPLYTVTGGFPEPTEATLNPVDSAMYTPQLQNLNGSGNKDISEFRFVGFPDGFYGWNPNAPRELYIVNEDWTEYTQYEVIENDQITCDAIDAGGLTAVRTSDNKWILYTGIESEETFIQLIEGDAAPGWLGCGIEPLPSIPPPPTVVTGDVIIRAWPLSLDGHDMYVLRLGLNETLIYDKYSEQWFNWSSKDNAVWAVNSGFEWLGGVGVGPTNMIVGDDETGALYFLDPDQPYDNPPTEEAEEQEVYFDRIVMGQIPIEGRNSLPCYVIFVTGDIGEPAYSGAGITLYTSDDAGVTWFDHGLVEVNEDVNSPELMWASLGQINKPGRLFMLIDDGALTRIDSMEMNDVNG